MPSSRPDPEQSLYSVPALYDLAFAFRDVGAECDGILALARDHGVRRPRDVVEIACGPGHHLREFSRRGLRAIGIDTSAEMLAYARALNARDGTEARFVRGDMRTVRLGARCDLALCLFDSFTHCTTDDDGIAALRATAARLRRGGLFILEVTHPADYFDSEDRRTLRRWTERRAGASVSARFDVSRRDAVAETYVATLTIDARFAGERRHRRVRSRQLHRMWLRSGIENIAARSGAFDIVGFVGDLERGRPLSMRLESWRMVAVLRRR